MTRYEILVNGLRELSRTLERSSHSGDRERFSCQYLCGLLQGYIDMANLLGEDRNTIIGKTYIGSDAKDPNVKAEKTYVGWDQGINSKTAHG